MQTEERDAILAEMDGLLKSEAWKLRNRLGNDFEDALGDARLAAVQALAKFDPSKCDAKAWVLLIVRGVLKERIRQIVRHQRPDRIEALKEKEERRAARQDTMARLEAELSDDALEVVQAIVHPPLDVRMEARKNGNRETLSVCLKRAIRVYFRERGWGGSRLLRAFYEVRQAL